MSLPPDVAAPPPVRRGWRARWGLPDVSGHGRFVLAIAVDALGSGVFMPLSILFFLHTTDVPLTSVGLAMSIAAAIAIPWVPVAGHLADTWGPKRLLVGANMVQAAGLAGYLVASSFPGILAAITVVSLGQSTFWASYSPTVAAVSRPGEREMWFGFLGALRNLGFAVGGLAAGVAVAAGSAAAFRAAVGANIASYLVAGALLATVPVVVPRRGRGGVAAAPAPPPFGGWRTILADRVYALVVLVNLTYALAGLALNIAIPVYATQVLGLPGWVVGGAYVVNTLICGFGQGPLVRAMTGHRRWRILAAGQLAFVAGYLGLIGLTRMPPHVAAVAMLLAVAVYTLGEIAIGPVITTVAVESRPAHLRGRYMSLFQLSWSLAGVVAPATYTWLLDLGPLPLWMLLIAVALAGAGLSPLLARRLPVAASPVTNAAEPTQA